MAADLKLRQLNVAKFENQKMLQYLWEPDDMVRARHIDRCIHQIMRKSSLPDTNQEIQPHNRTFHGKPHFSIYYTRVLYIKINF